MARRGITTTKILAVALLANVGCSKQEVHADPPATATASASVTAAASAPTPIASASADKVEDPKLIALRTELENSLYSDSIKQVAHYRPLCDQDGYPLVGNLGRKGPGMEPSQFCAEVRNQKH
jgi:hypothetical protein